MWKVPFAVATLLAMVVVAQAQTCPRGQYFCPGKVAGCCPNGWGCGSTKCIAPKQEPVRYGNCFWDGTRPLCAGRCPSGYKQLKREGSGCITGSRVYCCEPTRVITSPGPGRGNW